MSNDWLRRKAAEREVKAWGEPADTDPCGFIAASEAEGLSRSGTRARVLACQIGRRSSRIFVDFDGRVPTSWLDVPILWQGRRVGQVIDVHHNGQGKVSVQIDDRQALAAIADAFRKGADCPRFTVGQ
jgi:hypothetical protein